MGASFQVDHAGLGIQRNGEPPPRSGHRGCQSAATCRSAPGSGYRAARPEPSTRRERRTPSFAGGATTESGKYTSATSNCSRMVSRRTRAWCSAARTRSATVSPWPSSATLLEELLRADGHDVERRVVPDEADEIAAAIEELAATAELVLTTGGTGLAPRDVTPEATRTVLQREAPGIAEALRADSIAKTPHGLLSRGVAGVVGARAGRQPAGLDRRLPRRLCRAAAGARSCCRAARRPRHLPPADVA